MEVGCGGGALLAFLETCGCELVVGVDRIDVAIGLASGRARGVATVAADACLLPFHDASFTKIVAQHLIEHFANPAAVLSEWRRVLSPAGKLVIVTPNKCFPRPAWFDDPSHYTIFTVRQLVECVESAGFSVQTTHTINPFPLHLGLMFLAARHMQGLRRIPYFAHRGLSIVMAATRR
ncbi:MAG: class I SAM-dependent methyltransferase [Chloroflexi bacterium]|nr:class I SAM-dependent methyltransferase [Chloroflexota bacterium]